MDDQFLRKPRPKSSLGSPLKKIFANKRILVILLIVVPMLSFVSFSTKGILKRLSLESEKRAMEEKVRDAQREQVRMQEHSKSMDKDVKAIEKVAREKYGMIREGETVYKVKKER